MSNKKTEEKKETKEASEKKMTMNKKGIIICAVIVAIIIIVCIIVLVAKKGKEKKVYGFEDGMAEISTDIDYNNIGYSTIRFVIKNSTSKDIKKIYIRDTLTENFSNDLCGEIKKGEEIDVEYGNYSAVLIWDIKVVFDDGTEKTLNSLLAANVLYDGATLELSEIGDNVEAINHDMVTFDENGNIIDGNDNVETDTTETEGQEEVVEDEVEEIDETNTTEEVNETNTAVEEVTNETVEENNNEVEEN